MVVMTVIAVIGMAGVAHATPYNDAVLADNPYLYYPFDEANPTAVALSLVNQAASNDLTPWDGATRTASGTTAGGASLGLATSQPNWGSRFQTGVGNGTIGDGSVGDPENAWAVELWFRSTSDAQQYIWTVPSEWPHMLYGFDKTAPDPSQEVYIGGFTGSLAATGVSANEWHHVVFAWYSNAANEELWIDGSLAASGSSFSSWLPLDTLAVGGRNNGFGSNLNGSVDEFAIYLLSGNVAAQQAAVADIADHYNVSAGAVLPPQKIDVVGGWVWSPGPTYIPDARRADFANAYDDNAGTETFQTAGSAVGNQDVITALDFEEIVGDLIFSLDRIRISDVAGNGGNGAVTYTVRFTTDTDADLQLRTYTDVTGLAVVADMAGDTMPNVNVIGATVQHLDVAHNGYYSVTFDAIPGATGIALQWNNTEFWKHWLVGEIEAYGAFEVPIPEPAGLGLLGVALLAVRRRRK